MFNNIYRQKLTYKEYCGETDTNQSFYKDIVEIDGLRLKGQEKITHSTDGDTTTCTIQYKTPMYIVPKSLLNGREVMECIQVSGLGKDCGYLSYVK